MPDEKDDTYRQLEEAFSEADDAFRDDPSVVFGTEGERTGKLFDYLRRVWNPVGALRPLYVPWLLRSIDTAFTRDPSCRVP
jgi:hypothetical protein